MFQLPSVQLRYKDNFKVTQKSFFVEDICAEIAKKKVRVVRIHVSGDFYSADYVDKWLEIVDRFPAVTFYAYTRSWRVAEQRKKLNKLADRPNVRLWWSLDSETGCPKKVPTNVRLAYMSTGLLDVPDYPVDLIFRDYPIRRIVQKKINEALVCPAENGISHLTCEKCGVCWRETRGYRHKDSRASNRLSLPVIKAG